MPDPDFASRDSLKEDNLEVTLGDEARARKATESLRAAGVRADVTLDAEEDRRASMRADMRDEVQATVMGPGSVGPFTKAQSKGLMKWVTICTPIGVVAFLLIGMLVWPSRVGLTAMAAIGATAGATFGFVIGGSLGPRKHDEGYTDAESGSVVGVHSDDPAEIEKAKNVLAGSGASRMDRVNRAGRPVGSSSKDTRPLRGETPT